MNLGIRAILYSARKWKKTLLVFFLLLAITTLVLSGLAIADAQDITEILKESAHKMNKCVVVVTHSNELAKQADVVFRLKKGELQVLERVQDGAAQSQSRRNNAPRSERRAH